MRNVNPCSVERQLRRALGNTSLQRWLRSLGAGLSFWGAIALPVGYVPLFVSGINTPSDLGVFLGLFAIHILALIGGRHYQTGAQ